MLPEQFLTASLRSHPRGQAVTRILSAAIQAVEPANLPMPSLAPALESCKGDILLIGLGKAAPAMTIPLANSLMNRSPRGLLIPKQIPDYTPAGFEVIRGGHPIPDENSLKAGLHALELTRQLGQDDLLICLLSGGGSALMTVPKPGITLEDLQSLTSALLACGARIDEINILRRHLDQVKGGGLARSAAPAQIISFILSDVIGNPLEAIASGPTAPDPTTKADCFGVIEKYGLRDKIPAAILRTLENAPETPKPGDRLFKHVKNVIVGNNALAAQAAVKQAQAEGFHPLYLGDQWQGEARKAAKFLCNRLRLEKFNRPLCVVAGGETTVTLHGPGLGGRNQELALAAVEELAELKDVMLVTLATDGEDGPTDSAGAVVTGETYKRGMAQNLSASVFLANNDSYSYFQALDDLIKTGPTGTNVNDLTFLFAF
jgi:glycerate 2-kinase